MNLNQELYNNIINRDERNCGNCEKTVREDSNVRPIVPYCEGGATVESNHMLLCDRCYKIHSEMKTAPTIQSGRTEQMNLCQTVIARDDGDCRNCKTSVKEDSNVRPIVPYCEGGATEQSNHVLLCDQCHDAIFNDGTTAPTVRFDTSTGNDTNPADIICDYEVLTLFQNLPSASKESGTWHIPKANFRRIYKLIRDQDWYPQRKNDDKSRSQTGLGDFEMISNE